MPERKIVLGGPGCGKTTFVAEMLRGIVKHHGHDRAAVVTSLTRSGAREIASRDTGLDDSMAGTLHSFCYQGLGGPTIVTAKHLEEWNEATPVWRIHPEILKRGGFQGHVEMGDIAYKSSQLLRARRIDRKDWPREVLSFDEKWRDWLAETDRIDYQGLIDQALTDLPLLPVHGNVQGIVVDEAQDISRSERDLLEGWCRAGNLSLVFVGDPYQSLFTWRGADRTTLEGSPWRVLEQSYRVPRSIHTRALKVISRISVPFQDYGYRPADRDGSVELGPSRHCFSYYLRIVNEILETTDETVMILSAYSRHLNPVIEELRASGIPYGNPFNDNWAPLQTKDALGVTAFLMGKERGETRWLLADLKKWIPLIDASFFKKRGVKTTLRKLESSASPTRFLMDWIDPEKRYRLYDNIDSAWLMAHVIPSKAPKLRYPLMVYRYFGLAGLRKKPRVIPSTIHSVKGGEATTVILFPDLAPAQNRKLEEPGWEGADEVYRMMYVAVTRAKERLILGEPTGDRAVRI